MQNLRPHEDQNLWNFIFSMFFFVVLIGALWGIYATLGYFPRSLPVFDAVLLSLAAFRITRLIVYDKIARWFRELFADTRIVLKDGKEHVEVRPLGRGIRHTIYDLLQCPWCIGFWSGLIIVFCYFVFPVGVDGDTLPGYSGRKLVRPGERKRRGLACRKPQTRSTGAQSHHQPLGFTAGQFSGSIAPPGALPCILTIL
jgi:hypothetical protein